MKIKTGARILALSALTTMMFSASALAKIEEGKLVIWINGDKGYNVMQAVSDSPLGPYVKPEIGKGNPVISSAAAGIGYYSFRRTERGRSARRTAGA